jgi:hypothetical protein
MSLILTVAVLCALAGAFTPYIFSLLGAGQNR